MESLITTIIPTYERPSMLRRAIASALRQTYSSVQVWVYDDAGDPENRAVVASFSDKRLHYHRHPQNLGAFANFQFAMSRVDTPFFSILADDDVLLPHFYAEAVSALQSEPEAQFAVGRVVHVEGSGRVLRVDGAGLSPGLYRPPGGLAALVEQGHVNWVGILFRREVFETLPRLDADTGSSADLDFELSLAARVPFVVMTGEAALMVHHRGSVSVAARMSDTWPAFLKIIENAVSGPTIPSDLRLQLRRSLESQLAGRLYRIGRRAAREGRVEDADHAAMLIRSRYGRAAQAAVLTALARACATIPPSQRLLQFTLDCYRTLRAIQFRFLLRADYGRWLRP